MVNRVQTLRSSSQGVRPTGRSPGELYVNFPDRQIGVVDASAAAVDLVAVRFFSTGASYITGDYVIQAGNLYRAVNPSAPGAFVAGNWSKVQSAADLATGYLPLAGGTLTGALLLSGDPSVALNPVTLQYLQAQLAAYYPKTGGILNGNMQITPAAGNAVLNLNHLAAGQQSIISFLTNNVSKWQLGKQTNDNFFLYDVTASATILDIPSNGATITFGRAVILNADPSAALGAATKQYADSKISRGGDTLTAGVLTVAPTTGAMAVTTGNHKLMVIGNGAAGDAAYMAFHRPGQFAAFLGLDADSAWKVGGWSMGAVAYRLHHDGLANPVVPADPTAALGIATKQYVDGKQPLPGTIYAYVGNVAPAGYFLCNGQNINRGTNPVINGVLGGLTPAYPFGAGDGSTTMGIPDLRGRAPVGIHDMAGAPGTARISTATMSVLTLGGVGGEEMHVQTAAEVADHYHNSNIRANPTAFGNNQIAMASNTGTLSTIGTSYPVPSGNGGHNTMQPSQLVGFIMKGG